MKNEADKGQLAVISKNVVNVYGGPGSSEEQVTQAILGQPVWIEDGQGDWFRVRTWDGYGGWVQSRWVISRTYGKQYAAGRAVAVVKSIFSDILTAPDRTADILTKAVITTELEVRKSGGEWVTVTLPDGRDGYIYKSDVKLVDRTASTVVFPPSGDRLITSAKRFIGVPYLWGGTTPFGIDCSGFTQIVYHIHGITLLRDAHMQAGDPRAIPIERQELRAGDLVFFAGGSDKEKITHVGLAMGEGRFIHSAGGVGVMITNLDEPKYSDIYWGARRMKCDTANS